MARPTNAGRVLIAQRRARVLAMRVEQRPYSEIAAELGVSEDVAKKDFERAAVERGNALDANRDTAIAIEMAKLDAMERAVWKVLRTRHIVVQQGKIAGRYTGRFVRDEDGEIIRDGAGKPVYEVEEIEDDAPVLAAVDRLERIAARRSKLKGWDAPTKVEVDDARRAQIEAYAAELAAGLGDMDPEGAGAAPGDAEAG